MIEEADKAEANSGDGFILDTMSLSQEHIHSFATGFSILIGRPLILRVVGTGLVEPRKALPDTHLKQDCAEFVALSTQPVTNRLLECQKCSTTIKTSRREAVAILAKPHRQLEITGLDEARRLATEIAPSRAVATRALNQIDTAHEIMSEMPGPGDFAFQHAGLCQTCLPHRRPTSKSAVWKRKSGYFTLYVRPGVNIQRRDEQAAEDEDYVGVPYGAKARLILIYLQTEGLKSRVVHLGDNLSAFLRSLGVPRSGGPRGAIGQVKEQFTRIAGSTFTLKWDNGSGVTDISNTQIVDGARLWNISSSDWSATVDLSEKFHQHLREHAVILDKRAVAHLQHNSMGLDLYSLFAYRLPRLNRELRLTWEVLQSQIGSEYTQMRDLARQVRLVMPEVMIAYPHANVDVTVSGLLLKPSKPSVPPRTQVNGITLLGGSD